MIKAYLAGPIQFIKDYMTWRLKMTQFLESHGHVAINPLTKYGGKTQTYKQLIKTMLKKNEIDKCRVFVRAIIISPDYRYVEEADMVIVNYPKDKRLTGTVAEMDHAYTSGKLIFVVTNLPRTQYPAWMVGLSTRIFRSFKELKKYLKETFP